MIHVFTDCFSRLLLKGYYGSRPFEGRLPFASKELTTFAKLSILITCKTKYIILFLISWQTFAQDFTFKYDNSLKIIQNGQVFPNALAGGLNAPQFSTCKLDNDGVEDLVVFDRTAQKVFTFLARIIQASISGNILLNTKRLFRKLVIGFY